MRHERRSPGGGGGRKARAGRRLSTTRPRPRTPRPRPPAEKNWKPPPRKRTARRAPRPRCRHPPPHRRCRRCRRRSARPASCCSTIECALALKHSRWLGLLRKQVQAAPKRTHNPLQTPPEPTKGPGGGVWCSGGFLKTRKAANGANGANGSNGADGADGPNGADGADRADPHGNTPHARTPAHQTPPKDLGWGCGDLGCSGGF